MLNILLESHAPRPRRIGSTLVSAVLHVALMTGAVALTMPGPVDANDVATSTPPLYVVPPALRKPSVARPPGAESLRPPRNPAIATITVPDVVPGTLPPIDPGPAIRPDEVVIGAQGVRTASPIGEGPPQTHGGILDERLVDRAPRLLGHAPEPHYPSTLRDAGLQGRVVVQFVVDTLGRAEVGDLQVVEAAHPLFAEAVRSALGRYRFAVGQVAGRKVRTRVQMPFEFTLSR